MGADNQNEGNIGNSSCSGRRTSSSSSCNADAIPMPKHIPFPEFPGSSELINELVMFLFTTFAAAMQFINIYRTLWWLPESYLSHTVNAHLIDPYLLAFIVLLMSRRFVYCLLIRGEDLLQNMSCKYRRFYRIFVKYSFISCLSVLLGFCVFNIYINYSFIPVFLLVYPFIIYVLVFGFQIESFLRSSYDAVGTYFNGMPMHCCSSCPEIIRTEIDVLRNDFNIRFKQMVFTSMINAYFSGIVPCLFSVSIYYNVMCAYQNAFYIWISCLTMAAAFGFPSKYSDILHRASLHLGYWSRMDIRAAGGYSGGINAPSATTILWKPNNVWNQGSVVKYNGELFSSVGPITVALPGNSSHSRFFKLFRNPSIIYMVLTGLQAAIVMAGIIILYYTVEWHFILSLTFITLTNQFTFFKIMRDYMVTKQIYTAEATIAEQIKISIQTCS